MNWLKYFVLAAVIGVLGPSSIRPEERIGNLVYTLPQGWRKTDVRSQTVLQPNGLPTGVTCAIVLTADLKVSGDLSKWLDQYFTNQYRNRIIDQKVAIPYQDDPNGWESCALATVHREAATSKPVHHVVVAFRRGDQTGLLEFLTDDTALLQKYERTISELATSLKPAGGFPAAKPPENPPETGVNPPPGGANAGGVPPSSGGKIPPGAGVYVDYESEALPAPAPEPTGNPGAQAKALAEAIAKGGAEGLAALERAALLAGFSIHSIKTKAVLYEVTESAANGLSFSDFDLMAANRLTGMRGQIAVGDFANALRGYSGFGNVNFVELFRSSLKARPGDKARDQFLFALISELGRATGPGPIDLASLKAEDRLGAVPFMLMAFRSAGHMFAADRKAVEQEPTGRGPRANQETHQSAAIRNVQSTFDSFTNVDWDAALKDLVKPGEDPYLYILAITRIQMILSTLKAEIHVAGNEPLKRTKDFGKTGESNVVMVNLKLDQEKPFLAFIEAMEDCGYRVSDQITNLIAFDVRMRIDEGEDLVTVKGPGKPFSTQAPLSYSVPIEGALQTKRLPPAPMPEPRRAEGTVIVSVDDRGRTPFLRATSKVTGMGDIGVEWMKMSREFPAEIPVQDWKVPGWQLTLQVRVTGEGGYSEGDTKAEFKLDRSYGAFTTLPTIFPAATISGRTLTGTTITSAMTPAVGLGFISIDDWQTREGKGLGDCIEEDSYGKEKRTWKSRPAANAQEEAGSNLIGSAIEYDSKSDQWHLRAFTRVPSGPIVESLQESRAGKTAMLFKPENKMMGLYDGLRIVDKKDFIAGKTLKNLTRPVGSNDFKGSYSEFFTYYRLTLRGQSLYSGLVTVDWHVSYSGSPNSPKDLGHMAVAGITFSLANEWASQELGRLVPAVESDEIDRSAMATCYEVDAPVVGQLKHVKKPGGKGHP